MATYSEQLQQIANRYMQETGTTTVTAREIGAWAIQKGLWAPQPSALIRQCAEELSRGDAGGVRDRPARAPSSREARRYGGPRR